MKRILITLVAAIFLGVLGANAQSANRKGCFIELQGGQTSGDVYRSENNNHYLKGGMDVGFNFGYRFATSNHWAFQMKLGVSDNLSATNMLMPQFLLGMRWISNDFAGTMSAYIGLNAGAGIATLVYEITPYVLGEVEAGVNITRKFYAGLFANPRIVCGDRYWYEYPDGYSNYTERDKVAKTLKSNAVIGLRVGYRF